MRGPYLSVSFKAKHQLFSSPIFISKELLEKMRVTKKSLGKMCHLEYDPDLFTDKNIVETFKYVLENATPLEDIFGTKNLFYSQLPPSTTYVYVHPTRCHQIPSDYNLEPTNKDGKILFSTRAFCFQICDRYNEMIGCGIHTNDSDSAVEKVCYSLSSIERDLEKFKSGENIVSKLSKLNIEMKHLCELQKGLHYCNCYQKAKYH